MIFCLFLINISALFPSEELPASQPAPPDQPSVMSTDFLPFFTISHTHPQEASKHHAAVLGGTLAVTCMSPCLGPLISPAPLTQCFAPWKSHSFDMVCSKSCCSPDLSYSILPLWSFPFPATFFLISFHLLFPLFSSHQIENIPSNLSPLPPSLSFLFSTNWL